jgi:hypothetical protein
MRDTSERQGCHRHHWGRNLLCRFVDARPCWHQRLTRHSRTPSALQVAILSRTTLACGCCHRSTWAGIALETIRLGGWRERSTLIQRSPRASTEGGFFTLGVIYTHRWHPVLRHPFVPLPTYPARPHQGHQTLRPHLPILSTR